MVVERDQTASRKKEHTQLQKGNEAKTEDHNQTVQLAKLRVQWILQLYIAEAKC